MPVQTTPPLISVIIAAYNAEKHIREAVESILNQSFRDLECIVVNDASTDGTGAILASIAERDPRLRVFTNPVNKERCFSRNRALDEAKAEFVAIMDADDYSLPERLATQWRFMQQNPRVDLCGSSLVTYEGGQLWSPPCENDVIKCRLLFGSSLYHPTVFAKKNALYTATNGYDETMPLAEDYHLWARLCMDKSITFANVPTPLVKYRTGQRPPDDPYLIKIQKYTCQVQTMLLAALHLAPTEEETRLHTALSNSGSPTTDEEFQRCSAWLQKIEDANTRTQLFDSTTLHKELCRRYLSFYLRRYPFSYRHALQYFALPFAQYDLKTILKVLRRPLKRQRHRASTQAE